MSRRLLAVLLLPLLMGGLAAAVATRVTGADQSLFFVLAYGLTVPASLVAFLLAEWLIRTSPYGMVAAVAAGTAIRLVVCFGGGVALYFVIRPEAKNDKLAFWLWILFAYLTSLAVETAVLAKKRVK